MEAKHSYCDVCSFKLSKERVHEKEYEECVELDEYAYYKMRSILDRTEHSSLERLAKKGTPEELELIAITKRYGLPELKQTRVREVVYAETWMKTEATTACFTCEKSLCKKCVDSHRDHLLYHLDEGTNQESFEEFLKQVRQLDYDDQETRREQFMKEKYIVIDRVNIRHSADNIEDKHIVNYYLKQHFKKVLYRDDFKKYYLEYNIKYICVLDTSDEWMISDYENSCLKIFNMSNNRLVRYIKLSQGPNRITDVTEFFASSQVIAVSNYWVPYVSLIDISCRPARVIHTMKLPVACSDLAYYEGRLIGLYVSYCSKDEKVFTCCICIVDLPSGTPHTTKVIDLNRELPRAINDIRIAVCKITGTIFVCSPGDDKIISLNMTGQVLNKLELERYNHPILFKDEKQNIYVADRRKIQRLSSDLNPIGEIKIDGIDLKEVEHIAFHKDTLYFCDRQSVFIIQRM